MADLEFVLDAKARIAESPVWSEQERALYWTDIHDCRFNRLQVDTGEHKIWPLKDKLSSFALCNDGRRIVAAVHSGFVIIDLEAKTITRLAKPFAAGAELHLNDGRCDRSGKFFWAGSTHMPRTRPDGALFRLAADGSCKQMADGIIASNGIAFSPDNKIMYYADSRSYCVLAFDFDQSTGDISNRRTFISMPCDEGLPDGAAVDSQGYYWSCKFMGRRIVRHDPNGKLDRTIEVPFDNPTMVAFGGDDYKTLYITSGRGHLTPDELQKQPLAGCILKMKVDVAGLPEPHFQPSPALNALPTETLA